MPALKTNVTELPESRVRVEAEVPAEEVERRVQQAARKLGGQMRIPGFRKGKVPPPVVIRRLGREAVLDEALRSALGSWYVDAIDGAGIARSASPSSTSASCPGQGEPLAFSIEIGVRPRAKLGQYKGLEVGRREPQVDDVGRSTPRSSACATAWPRSRPSSAPAESGDHVVIDYLGKIDGEPFDGGEGRDQLIELGSGRLIPGFEEQLVGAVAGDEREVEVTFPEDYPGDLGGKDGDLRRHRPRGQGQAPARARRRLRLRGRRVRHAGRAARGHRHPAARGRRARDRARVRGGGAPGRHRRGRGRGARQAGPRARPRDARADAARRSRARASPRRPTCRSPARTRRRWPTRPSPTPPRRCAARRCSRRSSRPRRSSPPTRTWCEALAPAAERDGADPAELLEQLRKAGRLESLREDVAARQAVELLVREAEPISVEQAKAREKLWTPGKEDPASGSGQLWTPGSS